MMNKDETVALKKEREQEIEATSEETYQALKRNLKRRQGFGLLFVRCFPGQGKQLIQRIQQDIPQKKIDLLELDEAINNLYDRVAKRKSDGEIDILFITGIDKSLVDYIKPGIGGQGDYYKLDTVPPILSHLNLQRERFRDELNICLVFLVSRFVQKYFIRRAPDFFNWRSGIFEFPTDGDELEQESWRIVSEVNYQKYLNFTSQQRYEKILGNSIINDRRKSNF